MNSIKEKLKYIRDRIVWSDKATSHTLIKRLKNKGMIIGEGTIFFSPKDAEIDETRPYLIHIGKNVQIARNVTIVTHGYDWSVLKSKYGEILGSARPVSIGNNVFIGMNTTILGGSNIGNNVIIGAGSLISNQKIPDNCVVAGGPAKVLYSLDKYYEKKKKVQLKEAIDLARAYYERYHRKPNEEIFHEFFWLFSNNIENLNPLFIHMMKLMNNYDMTERKFVLHKPMFSTYDEFWNYCLKQIKNVDR